MATLKVTKGTGNNIVVLEYEDTSKEIQESMLRIIEFQPRIRESIKVEQIKESKPISLTPIADFKEQLPTKEDVRDYITSKPDFEHNYADLQEKFLGRRIISRGADQKLYLAFDGIVRRAKEQIAKEHKGEWKIIGHIDLGLKTRISVFKFVKSEEVKPAIQGVQVLEAKTPSQLDK